MYFPVGWPKYLSIPQEHPLPPIYVVSNRDRSLFTILTGNSLCIWFCKPCVEILSFRRSDNSVSEFGENRTAEWRPDSTMIAITTSKGYILFYKVDEDENVGNHQSIYVQKDGRRSQPPRKAAGDLLNGEGIPALKVSQLSYIQIQGGVTCLLCVRDDLLLSTHTGYIQRIRWDGCSNGQMSVNVKTVPFSTDLQFSRASTVQEENVNIPHMEYSPLLGGFAVVLSNGRAAFLTVTSAKFEPHQIQGVWAQEVNNASCVGVNHKYRLMTFGLKNGEGMVYSIDEITGALQISHKLAVSSKDYPDASHVVGSMTHIKWTPDGCALAAAWENGGFAVWSVFGALLFCSLGGDYGLSEDSFKHHSLHIKSMEWGAEGYHLWVMASRCDTNQVNGDLLADSNCNGETKEENQDILQLQFVKSSLTVNPCMSNHQHLFLQGEDRLYVNNGLERTMNTNSSKQQQSPNPGLPSNQAPSFLMGSKQWQVVTVPSNYLGSNWPIRYAAIDRAGQCVAIAGKYGLAHYALFNRKWKLFGNETQEKDMVVSGGLTWWRDFICVACYNILAQRDEIRLYPRSSKLDNVFATVTKVPSQVLLLNTFRDILIVLCADSHIMLFSIDRKNTQPNPTVEINKIQEVAIGGFIPHPASVTAITLTSLRTETASVRSKHPAVEAESILLNVAGRLLMFQRDRSLHVTVKDGSKQRQLPFTSPVMVASAVENVWSTPRLNSEKKHLVEALWLGCGAHGMKVWLPLFPRDDASAHGFMSKRIMLPFRVDIYPLAVLFEDAVILGATNDATCYDTGPSDNLPFLTLERTSQIYLHHILRQLLRRNLGHHALDIAHCCTELPYFPHCLELLLHEVLEEEATSKDPIPDPLLPRVVAFIQEFPEFLQTIAHCARKTEIALWHYLFNTVGNPREMFEECMLSGKLKTAASYLIILQNLEKPIVSRQHATMLLDTALDHNEWELARDLVRFLKAIDPSDAETAPDLPPLTRANSMGFQGVIHRTPPLSPDTESNEFVFVTNPLRGRGAGKTDQTDGGKGKEKSKNRTESAALRRRSTSGSGHEGSSPDSFFIDVLLARHARKLLTNYRLKDVGCFAANMEGYQLVTWLKKERLRAAKVEDFVSALKQLHQDFQWPLPILTNSEFLLLSRELSASSSSQGLTELEEGAKNLSVKDSGYMSSSTPVISPAATPDSPMAGSYVLLQPKLHIQSSRDDTSLAATEISDDFGESTSMDQSYCLEAAELELLCHELANKGPAQAELQLRYLLHIMMEAGCLEWSLLISILLRDVMAVVRTVNTASFTDTQIEIVGRMREGLSYLEMWADTECMGYKPFFAAIRGQIQTLQKIVEQNPPNSRMSTPRSRSSSVEKDTQSLGDSCHGNQNKMLVEEEVEEDEDRLVEELAKEQEQNSGYDCRIS